MAQLIVGIVIILIAFGTIYYFYYYDKKKNSNEIKPPKKINISQLMDKLQNNTITTEERFELAKILFKENDYEQAITHFEAIKQEDSLPKDMRYDDINVYLSHCHYYTGNKEKAIDLYFNLINKGYGTTEIFINFAIICLEQKRAELAIPVLVKAFKMFNQNADLAKLLFLSYIQQNELHKARVYIEKALHLSEKNDFKLLFNFSLLELLLKSYHRAFITLDKLSTLNIPSAKKLQVYIYLGLIHLVKNNYDTALRMFQNGFNKAEQIEDAYYIGYFLANTILAKLLKGDVTWNKDLKSFESLSSDSEAKKLKNQLNIILREAIPDFDDIYLNKKSLNSINSSQKEEIVNSWLHDILSPELIIANFEINQEQSFPIDEYIRENELEKIKNLDELPPAEDKLYPLCSEFIKLPRDEFIKVSEIVLTKLGLKVKDNIYRSDDDILTTEGDGIDFIAEASTADQSRYIVRVRRWNSSLIGELVIKNLAETTKMYNLDKGMLIATCNFTPEAINYVEKNDYINLIPKHQLEFLLNGVILPKPKTLFELIK